MSGKKFDPNEMMEIIEKLKAEGRLPSAEEFVRTATAIREKYRGKVIEAITLEGKNRRRRKE